MIDRDRPEGSAEIAKQVEAIEDLADLRGADARALGKDLGAVRSDNRETGRIKSLSAYPYMEQFSS